MEDNLKFDAQLIDTGIWLGSEDAANEETKLLKEKGITHIVTAGNGSLGRDHEVNLINFLNYFVLISRVSND
jgi:hypothetical protein